MNEFFIVGSQRSGTTLARLVLNSHPKVLVYDEVVGYGFLCTGRREGLTDKITHVGFKLPRFTEQLAHSTLKDHGIKESTEWSYGDQAIIFMLRDVRDTVCSMNGLMLGKKTSWLASYGASGLKAQLGNPAFQEKYTDDIAMARRWGWPLVCIGAIHWKYKTAAVMDYIERGWPVMPLQYEALVNKPRPLLRKTVQFLGLEWSPKLMQHHQTEHQELLAGGLAVGQTDPKRAIDTGSVERWREELTKVEVDMIMQLAGDLNSQVSASAL